MKMMKSPHVRVTRDAFLTIVGVAMLMYETISGMDRPGIIGAAVALCGIPLALWSDRMGRRNGNGAHT